MKFYAKALVAVGLLALLLYFVDWRETIAILIDASPGYFAIAGFWALAGITLSAWRWNVLLRGHDLNISFFSALRYYLIGAFFSNYLPSNIGGDVVRALVTRPAGKLAQVAASIIMERVTGLCIVLLLVCFSLYFRPEFFAIPGLMPIVVAAVTGLALAMVAVVFFGQRLAAMLRVIGGGPDSVRVRIRDKLRKFAQAIEFYRQRGRVMIAAFGLAVLFYASVVAIQYYCMRTVGGGLSWTDILFLSPIIPLVSVIPLSVNAIGVAEGAFVVFYTQAGLTPAQALAAALIHRLVVLISSLFGGLFWVTDRRELPAKQA